MLPFTPRRLVARASLLVASLLIAAGTLFGAAPAHATPLTVRAATGRLITETSPWGEELLAFKGDLETRTGGQLRVEPSFDGAAGDDSRLLQAVQLGRVELALIPTATLAGAMPDFQAIALPFVFDDAEQAATLLDGELFGPLGVVLEVQGLVLLRWEELGWEGLGSRDGFVTAPSALAKLPLYTQEPAVYFMTWSYAGATVKPGRLDAIDRYLEAGTVRGFAEVPLVALAGGWHQRITHYTVTRQRYGSAAWVASKAFVDKLTPELKDALLADHTGRFAASRKRVREHEARALQAFAQRGVLLHTLSDAERESFGPLAARIEQQYLRRASPTGQSVVRAVKKATGS